MTVTVGWARSRVLAIVCGLLVTLVVLTGCTGDRAAADFEAAFADDPAVASLELTSHDNQPFTGGVSGELRAAGGLSDDEFTALVDRVSAYTSEHADAMRGRITVVGDDVTLVVRGSRAADAARVAFAFTLLAEPGVAAVTLAGAERDTVSARVATTDDALALAARTPAIAADAGLDASPAFRIRTDDAATDLAGASGDTLDAASDAWSTLSAAVAVSGIRVDDSGITIVLADEADVAAAVIAADGVPGPLRFASPTVRLGVDADGALARSLLGGLDADTRARIVYVWESAGALQVTARGAEDLPVLVYDLATAPAVDPTVIRVRSDASPTADIALPSTGDLGVYVGAVGDLIALDGTTELHVSEDDVSVTVDALSDDELAAFAPSLKLIASPGARVCVHRPSDAVCVTAADSIDAGDVRSAGDAFVQAWNAAPAAP